MLPSHLKCVTTSNKSRNVPKVTTVPMHTLQLRSTITRSSIKNISAFTTHIPLSNVHMVIFAHLLTMRKKYWQIWSIITRKIKIFTCFTIKRNSVPSISPNTSHRSVFMLTTGRTIAENPITIHTSLLYYFIYAAMFQLENKRLHLDLRLQQRMWDRIQLQHVPRMERTAISPIIL